MKKIYLTVLIVFISITFSLYLTEGYINYKLSINEVNVSNEVKGSNSTQALKMTFNSLN